MHRRMFLTATIGFGLGGCSLFRNRNAPVPVVQEGFIKRPAPVAQRNMTAFLPEGGSIFMSGTINPDTLAGFQALREANPEANRLVFLDVDGVSGSAETLAFARAVRRAGFSTHVRNDSKITGGAIDAFLGGTTRTMEEGAIMGAVRSATPESHKAFATEMTGGDGYARFVQEFGGRRRPRPMTIAEIGAMGIVSADNGTVLAAN